MADNELKRLLQGLFSDIPTELVPAEAPSDERLGESLEHRDARELEKLAARFQTAARLSHAASSILTLDELLPQVVNLIRQEFNYYYVGVFLVDQHQEWAVLQAGTDEAGRQMVAEGHKLQVGGRSMIGWCVANAQARIALDVGDDAVHFDNPLLPDTRSEMALPLRSRGRTIGAMTIQSTEPAAFSEEDITILQTMADQLANAIENARLFQEREQRIAELAVINEIGQALSSVLELDELLEMVHRQVSRLFDTTNFYIATYEDGSDEWVSAFHLEQGQQQPKARYSVEAGLTGYIIRSHQPLLLRTREESIAFCQAHGLSIIGEIARSWLGVPLIAADKIVGVMAIQNYGHEHLYSEQDLALFATIGAQAANALENLRLLDETLRRAREMEAINEVGRAITSVLDLEQVLRQIVDIVKARFGHYFVGISLIEENQLVYQYGSTIGDSQARLEVGKVIIDTALGGEHGPSLIAEAARTGQPVLSDDVLNDPRYLSVVGLEDTRSELDVPIEVKGRVIGVLDIQSDRPFAFDQTDVALLQSLASQVGVAIENARLFEDSQEKVVQTQLLLGVSEATASTLDSVEVMRRIARAAAQALGADSTATYLLDKTRTSLQPAAGYHVPRDQLQIYQETHLSVEGHALVEEALGSRQTVVANDVANDPRIDAELERLMPARSTLLTPMIVKDQVIGLLWAVWWKKAHQPTDEERELVEGVVRQAAIAVENARLFEEAQQAARKLEEERGLLRTMIDNLPDFVYVKDRQSRFVINNIAHFRLMGAKTQDEVVGKADFDVFPQELAAQYYADEQELMRTGQILTGREEPIVDRATGNRLWVSTTKVPLRDAQGEIYGFVGMSRDITEWKQAEERLRESESSLRTILDSIQAGVLLLDRDTHTIIDVNPVAATLIGAPKEEIVGAICHQFVCPAEVGLCPITDLGQSVDNSERVLLTADGGRRSIIKTVNSIMLGGREHLLESFVDITERKEVELEREQLLAETQELAEALRVGEERYAMAVQASNTGLWDWDVANNTLYWSPELKGLLGYADDELEIDFDTYEALGHPGDRERTAAAIDVHLKDRVPYEVEQRLRAKSGEYRWFLVRGQAIWDEAGNPLRMAGSFTDFTERKETEAIVERRRGQLECLSDIGQKIGESLPLPEFLQWVAERIPSTMRFPDLCVAAIEFEGTVHGSAEAVKLPHQMVQSLVSGDERVGRLYIAYTEAHDFLDDESALLGDISRRVSGYIESSRLFAQTQAALAEVEATHRSYLRRSWQDHLRQREILQRSGFLYDGSVEGELTHAHPALAPAPDLWRSEMERAVQEGSLAIVEDRDTTGAPDTGDSLAPTERTGMAVPITLRGETIGVLGVEAPGNSHHWTEDDMALIQAVGDQLGQTLETARLFADTQRRAERERLIGEITTKIRASTDMRDILETAAVELGQALGTSRAFVQVGIEELEAQRPLETRPSVEPSGGDGHSVGAAEE